MAEFFLPRNSKPQKNGRKWPAETGGRLKKILPYVADDPFFALTYGDGVADIDVTAQIAFHRAHGRKATVTAVRQPTRFGALRQMRTGTGEQSNRRA